MMQTQALTRDYLPHVLLAAPFIFICHFVEELPTFVDWFNAHVSRDITPESFWSVNLTALVITVIVVSLEWFSRSALSLGLAITWFSFLMLANALLHLAGSFLDGQYVPGVATAVLFYLPYYAWLFACALKSGRVSVSVLLIMAVLGSVPMLVHGYLILFRSSRLF